MSTHIVSNRFVVLPGQSRQGGSSVVHKAIDLHSSDQATIALKVLSADGFSPPEVNLFFEREKQALMALQHPNIVQLIDTGQDEQTGDYYLALEWVDTTLTEWLGPEPPGFDDFVEAVALPLASALAFAHERSVVHRDIKPSNVLVSTGDIPKLADFGISKIKNALTGGPMTAAAFGSRPYAAPEVEGTASYARDVYGFGALMLACLSDVTLDDYPDIQVALDSLDVSPELHSLIERCVDFDPAGRPQVGSLLSLELESLQQRRHAKQVVLQVVHLALTKSAIKIVGEATGTADPDEVKALLEADLNDVPTFRPQTPAGSSPDGLQGRHFYLAGSQWSLQVTTDDKPEGPSIQRPAIPIPNSRFNVIHALQLEPGDADKWRELNFAPSDYRLTFAPPLNHHKAEEAIRALVAEADEDELARQRQREQREENRLFDQWYQQLNAREGIESGKEAPLQYTSVDYRRRRATFTIPQIDESPTIDEHRRVVDGGRRLRVRGMVDDVSANKVTLYLDEEYRSIPPSGVLVRDTAAARSSISRERDALTAVRMQGPLLVRPELPKLLIYPDLAALPQSVAIGDDQWLHEDLDVDKKDAVQRALGAEDFFVVQGPPGTGKTTLITELIAQELRRNPQARILLTSQTNVALDHALARLSASNITDQLVRLAGAASSIKVADQVASLLLESRMGAWSSDVRRRSTQYIEQKAKELGLELRSVRAALLLRTLSEMRREEVELKARAAELTQQIAEASDPPSDPSEVPSSSQAEEVADERDEVVAQLSKLARDTGTAAKAILELSPDLGDALEDGTAEDALLWSDVLLPEEDPAAVQMRELVALQGQWLERLGHSDEFQAPLLAATSVVAGTCVGVAGFHALDAVDFDLCILDEASKATATEALVPLVRARRWVLVGDRNQLPPFQEEALKERPVQLEYSLDEVELRTTLFDRLSLGLPEACSAMLRTQHRMVAAIGELISDCFYSGALINEGPSPEGLGLALPTPVVWFTTSPLPDHSERPAGAGGKSYLNTTEARQVVRFLARLDLATGSTNERKDPLEVLVLSPYRPQVAEIHSQVSAAARDWANLAVEVNSVDAAQGREADVVVFSVTRSNPSGKFGFLNQEARANVALSRGRLGLAIIGDSVFCSLKEGPLLKVLYHIKSHPESCSLVELAP